MDGRSREDAGANWWWSAQLETTPQPQRPWLPGMLLTTPANMPQACNHWAHNATKN